jgi:hypothetical protein
MQVQCVSADKCEANYGELAKILSTNERFHHYAETAQEFLSNLISKIADCPANDNAAQEGVMAEVMNAARAKHATYVDILSTTPILDMLVKLYPMKSYFVTTSIFKPYELRKQIKVHGGVSEFTPECTGIDELSAVACTCHFLWI